MYKDLHAFFNSQAYEDIESNLLMPIGKAAMKV